MSKGKNKNKVLNLYAAEINNQRRHIKKANAKTAKKANERASDSSSDEDNNKDLQIVDCPIERISKHKKRKVSNDIQSSLSDEEKAFKLANLGQATESTDESTVSSEDSVP